MTIQIDKLVIYTKYLGSDHRGLYPWVFKPFDCTEKTRPRKVPALAPNDLKLSYDALASHPQPMLSTHTTVHFFLFGHGIGAKGAAAKEGAT